MTEIYGLFDAADPEAPDRVYTSEAFARLFRTIMRDGIVHNDGDELAVSPTVPAAMSVNVGTGMALVQGRYYINSADLTLDVAEGQTVLIDTTYGSLLCRLQAANGTQTNAMQYLTSDSTFWQLQPGENIVTFSAPGGSAGVSIEYVSRYTGV